MLTFASLGTVISERWARANFDEKAFPSIAAETLAQQRIDQALRSQPPQGQCRPREQQADGSRLRVEANGQSEAARHSGLAFRLRERWQAEEVGQETVA